MYIDSTIAKSRTAVIAFASPDNAERNVAGLPAAARAVRQLALAGMDSCVVTTGARWRPSERVMREIERLAPGVHIVFPGMEEEALGQTMIVDGDQLFSAEGDLAERRILLATAKPGDGLVSRMINRPVSRSISRLLLRLHWIRPIHATATAAAVAVAMAAALLGGGSRGQVIGAFLFQAASVLDGVDGEIARATFRTSRFGAAADSLVDAVTNVAFIGGVAANLWMTDREPEAALGAIGLAAMALGLLLIGLKTRRSDGPFTFDLVKNQFKQRPTNINKWLTWLTMRDFYALAGFAFVASGHAGAGLVSFAVVAVGWLAVVCAVMVRAGTASARSGQARRAHALQSRLHKNHFPTPPAPR